MKIFISETDRQNAKRVALRNLAKFFDIPNWEYKENDELFNDLSALNTETSTRVMGLLNTYFNAYDDWFNFYDEKRQIEQQSENEYQLNENEQQVLGNLINRRESSLQALQERFDELQVQKFNRENFGGDINGIIDQGQ